MSTDSLHILEPPAYITDSMATGGGIMRSCVGRYADVDEMIFDGEESLPSDR